METTRSDGDETRDPRIALRVGRVAFFLAAAGAALSSGSLLLYVLARFGGSFFLQQLLSSPIWDWAVVAPATLFAFLGAMLLIGRGRPPEWQLRAILLLLINSYVLGFWLADHARALGFDGIPEPARDDDLRHIVYRLLGLVGIVTLAGLARDETLGFAWPDAEAVYRAARGAVTIGIALWLVFASRQYDWQNAWPPRFVPIRDAGTFLVFLGIVLARAVAGFFAVVLCWHACVLCSKALARVEIEIKEGDPFRSRSESGGA